MKFDNLCLLVYIFSLFQVVTANDYDLKPFGFFILTVVIVIAIVIVCIKCNTCSYNGEYVDVDIEVNAGNGKYDIEQYINSYQNNNIENTIVGTSKYVKYSNKTNCKDNQDDKKNKLVKK